MYNLSRCIGIDTCNFYGVIFMQTIHIIVTETHSIPCLDEDFAFSRKLPQ